MFAEMHLESMPPQKPRRIWRNTLLTLVILGLGAYWLLAGRSQFFIWSWSRRLHSLGNLSAIEDYTQTHPRAPLYLLSFPSGEWVAVAMEHACCSGAGFNATIFYDSSGATYIDTTHSFCGVEGSGEELGRAGVDSLATFYPQLGKLKLHRQ